MTGQPSPGSPETPVIILCGGIGARMREETEFRPKPLVEIGSRPLLWHVMKNFDQHGFSKFILCLGYRGNMIKEYFLNFDTLLNDFTIKLGSRRQIDFLSAKNEGDYEVTLIDTGQETLTGGRVKRVMNVVGNQTFIVSYGDTVSDVHVGDLMSFHRSHGRMATLTTVNPVSRYGVLDLGPDGTVERFREKPQADGSISAGFFVFEPDVAGFIDGDDTVLEEDVLPVLAQMNQLMAYRHGGFWMGVDTFKDVQYLNGLWNAGRSDWLGR